MKKWICVIITGLLVVIGCVSFAFAGTADGWNLGSAVITDKVTAIEIDSGEVDVFLKTGTGKEIEISEASLVELSDDQKVHWQLDGTTLRIKYLNSVWNIFDFLLGDIGRSLTVTIPEDLVLDSLEIDVASADLTTDSLQAKNAELESASGDLSFAFTGEMETVSFTSASGEISAFLENAKEVVCGAASGNVAVALSSADTLKAETSSGDINLMLETVGKLSAEASSGEISVQAETVEQLSATASSGEISVQANAVADLSMSTSSGEIDAVLGSSPETASISTASGDVTLTLPENADLTVEVSTAGGDFTSQLALSMDGKTYTCGNGTGQMKISTASGDISLRKGK